MTHYSETIVLKNVRNASGVNPILNLSPGLGIFFEHPCYLKERNTATCENIGNLWHRAGLTIGKPFRGHLRSVAETVETFVIDRRTGRQVEDDDWDFCTPDCGKHCGRERVSCNVQKYEIDICPAELMTCPQRFFRI